MSAFVLRPNVAEFLSNPDPDVRIEPGQVLIAIGTEEELEALSLAAR